MPPLPSLSFHHAAVRDALGLVRLLFALEREGTDVTRTATLTNVGTTLADCLRLGTNMRDRPDTVGYRAAMHRSWDAVDKLAAMEWPAHLAELVRHAQSRVKGTQPAKETDRDVKRRALAARG